MVALSPANDAFQKKCTVAIVAARPLERVKQCPPEIDIYFAAPEEIEIDPQQEWIMVEARTGYFEATRYTLCALQQMMKERYIILPARPGPSTRCTDTLQFPLI